MTLSGNKPEFVHWKGVTMVTRQGTVKRTGTRRRVVEPVARPTPAAPLVRPQTVTRMRKRFETAGRKLQTTGQVAGRFARSSLREMTGAVRASREPMTALWRNVRLAGRHVMRDAVAAWHEVVPAAKAVRKPAAGGKVQRAAG
jgi:hypothetical protein